MEGEQIPGMNRSDLKRIKPLPLAEFRRKLLSYTDVVYNQGISDCLEALHVEFGFGRVRIQRIIDYINRHK